MTPRCFSTRSFAQVALTFFFAVATPGAASLARQSPPPPASSAITTPALQREIISVLAGETEIRPGVKLVDRFTPENRQDARTYLMAMLTRIGLEPKRHTYATGENIYAVLSCGKSGAETVVLGAHYDSVKNGPGANDDASGVAAVAGVALEMAHLTSSRSKDVMFVFFDEEERGLVGSKAFAQMLKDQNVAVNSVHTIDQIAWDSNGNRAVEIERPYEGAMELYQKASDGLKPPIALLATSETGSDHQAFRRLGFKAVGMTEEYHHGDTTPFYHKPGDTFQTVNFDYLTSSTGLVVAVMKALTK